MGSTNTTSTELTELPEEHARSRRRSTEVRLLMALFTLAVIYSLYLAQKIFVPIVLAFLLSLVFAPVVRWFERLHIPRTIGAGITVILLISSISYGLYSSLEPVTAWFDKAPSVLRIIERKLNPIKETVEEVSKTAEHVDRIATVSKEKTVVVKGISFREILYSNARALITGAIMTILLLYFLLSWGWVIILRIARILGERGSKGRFLEFSSLLEGEISKYLSTVALINAGLGLVVALALYLLDMPSPLLWGAVAALMNFIPYLGGLVTALLLGITALLTSDGLAQPALIVGVFTFLTIFEGQIVTPLILGRQLTLNPLAVFLSVVFWFWLWGVMGALMAVPLLIILNIISSKVKWMKPIGVITGR